MQDSTVKVEAEASFMKIGTVSLEGVDSANYSKIALHSFAIFVTGLVDALCKSCWDLRSGFFGKEFFEIPGRTAFHKL